MEQPDKERIRYLANLSDVSRSLPSERESCIVDGCDAKPIRSHLIPKGWMSLIARDSHVIDLCPNIPPNTPTTLEDQFYENHFRKVSRPVGINQATSTPVFCAPHDNAKQGVGLLDDRESELNSMVEQHILFYKAICFSLLESELVLSMKDWIMEQRPRAGIERDRYFLKQQILAHRDLLTRFNRCLQKECDGTCSIENHIEFKRIFIKGDRIPTVAAIGCGSGLNDCGIVFGCESVGCQFPRSDFMVACKPVRNGHIVIIARTHPNYVERGYCKHIGTSYQDRILTSVFDENPPQGTKLEQFISAELIGSSKGFICSPDRWEGFGPRMRDVVKHHFVQQPSRLQRARKSRFPTEINRRFNLFRNI